MVSRLFDRKINHTFVKDPNGNTYAVMTDDTPDRGHETMVFTAEEVEPGICQVASWQDLYAEWYTSERTAKDGHVRICDTIIKKGMNGLLKDLTGGRDGS